MKTFSFSVCIGKKNVSKKRRRQKWSTYFVRIYFLRKSCELELIKQKGFYGHVFDLLYSSIKHDIKKEMAERRDEYKVFVEFRPH
jgi:hypothetical protein